MQILKTINKSKHDACTGKKYVNVCNLEALINNKKPHSHCGQSGNLQRRGGLPAGRGGEFPTQAGVVGRRRDLCECHRSSAGSLDVADGTATMGEGGRVGAGADPLQRRSGGALEISLA